MVSQEGLGDSNPHIEITLISTDPLSVAVASAAKDIDRHDDGLLSNGGEGLFLHLDLAGTRCHKRTRRPWLRKRAHDSGGSMTAEDLGEPRTMVGRSAVMPHTGQSRRTQFQGNETPGGPSK